MRQAGRMTTADTPVGRTGQRVRLSGGFEATPSWLGDRPSVTGVVSDWIPGQNEVAACVIELDEPLTTEGDVRGTTAIVTGRHVVLQLRYTGQVWERTGIVHVELCGAPPEPEAWPNRQLGAWVDSHATYEFTN